MLWRAGCFGKEIRDGPAPALAPRPLIDPHHVVVRALRPSHKRLPTLYCSSSFSMKLQLLNVAPGLLDVPTFPLNLLGPDRCVVRHVVMFPYKFSTRSRLALERVTW